MRTLIQPIALLIANAGVFTALTVASAEVAYKANESKSADKTPVQHSTDLELAKARRIIDSMERHGIRDEALQDLKHDLSKQLALHAPSQHQSQNEYLRFRTADGRWRGSPVAGPISQEIQPLNERADFTPQLNEQLFQGQAKQAY
ncbi:MAG: hypothetical protein K2X77_23850 [Candidatus Obscuribacterales bacterium]|jgi:hypothetical protein|nr:hypothetical protein [Candidatus Obscuribacterales bacterium]